jgi:endonuclease/exonuclease/phosphatase family metal-dependent hydrolase
MHLVTYNIQYGLGRDGRYDLERVGAAVDGADVIALQEVERYWPRSGMVDQVKRLSKLVPEYWWTWGPNVDLFSPTGFPGEGSHRRRQFGNLLLSRTPILSARNIPLPRIQGPLQTMQRGALEAIVTSDAGRALRVYSTHLTYASEEVRRLQLGTIFDAHKKAIAEEGPWAGIHPTTQGWMCEENPSMPESAVVLGDMNLASGSDEYERLFRDEHMPFVDAWTIARGDDTTATHEAGHIDHIWVTPDLAAAVSGARVDTEATGSDHQPVWLTLDI